MSNLIRHVILKDNIVINVIEYETLQTDCPEGLEDVIAIASDEGQIGWVYSEDNFTNPNPDNAILIPLIETPKFTTEELMIQLQNIQTQLLTLQGN